jgi:lysophospholipase L1-like esterase
MLIPFLAVFAILVLVVLLIAGNAFYQSMKLPDNSPTNYLKRQKPDDQNSVVVLLGDSITHGRIGVNYVDIIEEQLGRERFEFINAGINSELAWNNLQRIDDVIQCDPDIVTVLVGTNDANAVMAEVTMKSYVRRMKLPRAPDIDWYRECLTTLVKRLKTDTNARIALLSIPTIGEDSNHLVFTKSSEYSEIVHDVAKDLDVAYLPLHEKMVEHLRVNEMNATYPYEGYYVGIFKVIMSHYLLRKSWDDIARDSGFSLHVDYLHLNTAGAQMIADLISDFIKSTLTHT